MSEIIDKYEICSNISEDLKTKIKSFSVFDDIKGYNVLFITSDDNVHGFGQNTYGSGGLGHNRFVEAPEIIPELCQKNIKQFFNGYDFVLALSINNHVYGWGKNDFGQLGRGHSSDPQEYLKAEIISFEENENIIQVSCGLFHSLALTSTGIIYGWGDNRNGQILVNRFNIVQKLSSPIAMKSLSDILIKSIQCLLNQSFALTGELIIIWGRSANKLSDSIELTEIVIKNMNIVSICPSFDCIFSLTIEGSILIIDKDITSSYKVKEKILGLFSINEHHKSSHNVIAVGENKIYTLRPNMIYENDYIDLLEMFSKQHKMTPRTLEFDFKDQFEEVPEFGDIKMVEFLNKFNIFSRINNEMRLQIKTLYSFNDAKGYNIVITYNGEVFTNGQNTNGNCGLGHNKVINEPQSIPELCQKNIKQIYSGLTFVLALTLENKLLSWGSNAYGELGRGKKSEANEYLKPDYISNTNIQFIQISCGYSHTLAISLEGDLYAWGSNETGQVGCGMIKGVIIEKPFKFGRLSNFPIRSIHASFYQSFCLTNNGSVYSWGHNISCVLGLKFKMDYNCYQPSLINLDNVIDVCSSTENTYFLKGDGSIYFCGLFKCENNNFYQQLPRKLNTNLNLISLHSVDIYRAGISIATGSSDNCVYYICLETISEQKHKNVITYFLDKFNVTYKSLSLKRLFYYDEKVLNFLNKNEEFQNRSYENEFQTPILIGNGAFGDVFKVKSKIDKKDYAIKKIDLSNDNDKLEIEVNTLREIDSEFVVRYFESWNEDSKFTGKCLFIKMELCADNLKNIIEQKPKFFNRILSDEMNSIEYFISCNMFRELLECVQFLHELPVPIIHRDIKPENILIAIEPKNGRYLKIADFGLATYQEMNTMTHTKNVGTGRYMAPEVWNAKDGKSRYSVKADIYGLAVTAQELFDYDINNPDNNIQECLSAKWNELSDLNEKMMNTMYRKRPTCSEVLNLYKKWAVDKEELKSLNDFKENFKIFEKNPENFLSKYFKLKFKA